MTNGNREMCAKISIKTKNKQNKQNIVFNLVLLLWNPVEI